jgi:hypothetical protein
MFRLAGENDESIFEIKVSRFNQKELQDILILKGGGGWGWGFNTPSQSLVNAYEPGDVRKTPLLFLNNFV